MKPGRQQLTAWMERRRLSGREASKLIGMHWAHLSQIVNGHRVPGLMVAVRIERATDIPVESWLLTCVGKSDSDTADTSGKSKSDKVLAQ